MTDQLSFNFDNDEQQWPNQDEFPVNWKNAQRKVIDIVKKDLQNTSILSIATGFTSLGYIVDFSDQEINFNNVKKINVVLGFEPERIYKRKKWGHAELDKSVKEYWLTKGISVFKSGSIINTIERIKNNKIDFKLLKKLHAKIYLTDNTAMLGSSNFSKNGLYNQIEANVRADLLRDTDERLYEGMKKIINNYLRNGQDYNTKIINLLEKLLLIVSWQEALARAIYELLENENFNDYPILLEELNKINLWPSQRMAMSQALNILKEHGTVLIAEPTGSGKTKLISSIRLALTHRFVEARKKIKLETLIICPKIVEKNWRSESLELAFISESHMSMGLLSNGKEQKVINTRINGADLLIIDEAHNFLSYKSKRSQRMACNNAENIVLSTATPINKRAKDLLRLIELLDVGNLNDQELDEYIKLRKEWSISSNEQLAKLSEYIWRFTVRRTKKELKKLIAREPEKYINIWLSVINMKHT